MSNPITGRYAFILLTAILRGLTLNSAAAAAMSTPTITGPRAVFLPATQKPTVVLGGSVAHLSFKIMNTGTALLEILDAVPSCGCTTTSFDRYIPPGGAGVVRADVQTESTWTATTRELTVFTNDPRVSSNLVRLSVAVTPVVTVVPGAIVDEISENATPVHRQFKLRAEDRSLQGIELRMTTTGPVSARIHAEADGLSWIVDTTVTPYADGSDTRAGIALEPTPRRFPPINLYVILLGPGLTHSPDRVSFGTIKKGESVTGRSLIVSSRKLWFHISRVTGDPHLAATWERLRGSICMWKVNLRYDGGWPVGVHEGVLSVVTDASPFGTTSVPFRAEVLP